MAKSDHQEALANLAANEQRVPNPHAALLLGTASGDSIPLTSLDGRSIALQLSIAGRQHILIGRGEYRTDPDLGNVLRIQLADDPDSQIVLSESGWNGQIIPAAPTAATSSFS